MKRRDITVWILVAIVLAAFGAGMDVDKLANGLGDTHVVVRAILSGSVAIGGLVFIIYGLRKPPSP